MKISEIIKAARNVDWGSLECIEHQPCRNIPDALAGLCSDDPQLRQRAYWKFDNHVVVQSGLYNSAFYVIPFVIQLLKENIKSNRHNRELYDLLFELGNGCGPGDVEFSIVTEPFTHYIPKNGGIKWSLPEACYNAVFAGWNIYYEDLMNQNSPNRKYALELISSLYRNNIIIRNTVLQQLIDREPDSEIGKLAADEIKEELYPYTSPLYPKWYFLKINPGESREIP